MVIGAYRSIIIMAKQTSSFDDPVRPKICKQNPKKSDLKGDWLAQRAWLIRMNESTVVTYQSNDFWSWPPKAIQVGDVISVRFWSPILPSGTPLLQAAQAKIYLALIKPNSVNLNFSLQSFLEAFSEIFFTANLWNFRKIYFIKKYC